MVPRRHRVLEVNKRFVGALLCVAAVGCATPRPSNPDEGREVVRTVERLFEGMRTQDTAVLRALLAPELIFVSARDTAGHWRVTQYTAREFLTGMAEPVDTSTQFRERMWKPEVRIDGAIATLWTPYDFHVGARFSHCGYDAFQLARGERGWYITAITYTVRPTPCSAPPVR